MSLPYDDRFMAEALALARKSAEEDEVPVGAVVVLEGRVIGRGRNRPISLSDPSAHAEVIAIREAARNLGRPRLDGAVLYSTLEPCPMCAGLVVLSRISRVVFGTRDDKFGAAGSILAVIPNEDLNHRPIVEGGLMAERAADLLSEFFREKRIEAKREG